MTHEKPVSPKTPTTPAPTTAPIPADELARAGGALSPVKVAGWTNTQDARKFGAPVIVDDGALGASAGGSTSASADASRAGRVQKIDGAANTKGEPWKDGGPIQV